MHKIKSASKELIKHNWNLSNPRKKEIQNNRHLSYFAEMLCVCLIFVCAVDIINIEIQLIPSFWSHKISLKRINKYEFFT